MVKMSQKTILTAIQADFLKTDINEKYDLVMMNPPWKEYGVPFINKGVNLLNDGGELVCVMDYNKFTRSKAPGTFLDLQQRGYFKFIRCDSSRNKSGPFPGIGDSVAFVFVKGRTGETIIKNRVQETFSVQLMGNEKYPPQIPNESDIFDWSKNGIKIAAQGAGQKFDVPTVVFANRETVEKMKFGIFDSTSGKNFSGARVQTSKIDTKKFKEFLDKWNKVFWDNYCVSHGWMRLPPLRADLDFWIHEKTEEMEEW
jgi:hypothetical protein